MTQGKKTTTKSLEQSKDLVVLGPDVEYDVSSPYGECQGECTVTVARFERGNVITLVDGEKTVFSKFIRNKASDNGDKKEIS